MPRRRSPVLTPESLAARRANSQLSTGPRTGEGKQRVTLNLQPPSPRLLGLADARTLNQEPGMAEALYRRLIAPYEPAPPLLALHFQDLARLCLELQALERIRDAQLDHRAQQTSIEVRRRYRDMDRELTNLKESFESGLYRLEDSPGKFKAQGDCLSVLKAQLQRRDFGEIGVALRRLYGKDLNPDYERGQLICFDGKRLMNPEGREPVSDQEFDELLRLLDREEEDALEGYEIQLDERTVTGPASLTHLAPTRQDHWMNAQGDRLRRAIDRNKRLLLKLLEALGLADRDRPTGGEANTKRQKKIPYAKAKKSSRIKR